MGLHFWDPTKMRMNGMEQNVPKRNSLRGIAVGNRTPAAPRRRKWSRKKILVLIGSVTAICFVSRRSEPVVAQPMAAEPLAAVVEEKEDVKEVPAVVDCKVYPYKHYSKYLKDKLPAYKSLSLAAGISPIKDEPTLNDLLANGYSRLVEVKEDDAMHIAEMDHGKPYLTPTAHAALKAIAKDFKKRIEGTDLAHARLKVTSLLRTSADQRKLGRSNVNATRDADAPHTHGTSVDISYMKFISQKGEQLQLSGCQQVFLAETLAEVINDHKKADPMLFAIRERQQACYHLSVCR